VVSLFHVDKMFQGGIEALSDVSVEVSKGEFVFITGSSGAGKSTLLRLVFGTERASRGQIIVNGRNITRIKPSKIARFRRDIGFIFQDFKLLPDRNIFENIAFVLRIIGAKQSEIKRKTLQALFQGSQPFGLDPIIISK